MPLRLPPDKSADKIRIAFDLSILMAPDKYAIPPMVEIRLHGERRRCVMPESVCRTLAALWQLMRLEHGIMYGGGVILGVFLAASSDSSFLSSITIIFGVLTALLLQAGTFALNDYCDSEVDILNRRTDRPIVRGDLSRRAALIVSLVAISLGIACAFFLPTPAFSFAIALATAALAYDIKLKEIYIAGNAYIAFTMASPFIFGGLIVGRLNSTTLMIAAIAFTTGFGREVMKDIGDIKGDLIRNVRSIAITRGIGTALKTSIAFFIVSIALSILPFVLQDVYFMNFYYIAIIFVADIVLMHVCLRLYRIYRTVTECENCEGSNERMMNGVMSDIISGKDMVHSEMEACRRETLIALAVGMFAFMFPVWIV